MIFTKIRLHPFAGLGDTTLEFAAGRNTVLGANEAGKSTVFRALEAALLTRTDLTPARLNKFVDPYKPLGGGDTIAVELHFEHDGGCYVLRRQWGAANGSRLALPDGGQVAGEDEIAARVADMLGVSAATCRSILFTRQTVLPETLAALREQDDPTVRDLSDLLSAAMQETDGISIEALKARLDQTRERFFGRWDTERRRPEGNRGIDKPWKKGVGVILEAYYAKEKIRRTLDEARATEQRVDELNADLAALNERIATLSAYIERHGAVKTDAARRQVIDARLSSLDERSKRLRKDNEDWPLAGKAVDDAEKEMSRLRSRIEELRNEESDVRRFAEGQALRDLAKRVELRRAAVEQAKRRLADTPELPRDRLERIDDATNRRRELEVKLAAVKLRASLTAAKDLSVRVRCGLAEPSETTVAAQGSETIYADGRLSIAHDDWALEVQASDLDIETIAGEAEQAALSLQAMLAECDVTSRDEAVRFNAAYEQAVAGLENAESNLAAELGEHTPEELERRVADDEPGGRLRSLDEVVRESADAEHALRSAEQVLEENRRRLVELKTEYGDADGLFETMANTVAEKKELEKETAGLAPLPDGIDDVEAFLDEYARQEEELGQIESAVTRLRIEKAGIRLPDESTEELETRLTPAEEDFERAVRQGQAIERIVAAVDEVEAEAESGGRYADFKARIERYVSRLTSDRYGSIQIDDGLPSGFVRGDGRVLGAHLLSTGTRDVLGLAVRLAMAAVFLNGRRGFLVMDDPLVDMDPSRRRQAAALLRDYAEDDGRQVIVFTCHPSHAEILGGRKVELG